MPDLNLFPSRASIGSVTLPDGSTLQVTISPELLRAFGDLVARIGGVNGTDAGSIELLSGLQAAPPVGVDPLLVLSLATLEASRAEVADIRRRLENLEIQTPVQTPPDWEHPGKIGYATPSTAKFTALEATSDVKLNPNDRPVDIKPTGVSLLTIQPAQPGQIDNMELGKTAPRPARITSINKVAIAEVLTSATLSIADTKSLTVSNTVTLAGTDGATLNFGGGGTLGTAAYTSSASYAPAGGSAADWQAGKFGCNGKGPQSAAASGGTLAGVIAALVANGILSS